MRKIKDCWVKKRAKVKKYDFRISNDGVDLENEFGSPRYDRNNKTIIISYSNVGNMFSYVRRLK